MSYDFDDLIPADRLEIIREEISSSSLEDEDIFPLGEGRYAIFRARSKIFEVRNFKDDSLAGKVSLKRVSSVQKFTA